MSRFDSGEKFSVIIVPSFPRNVQTVKINSREFFLKQSNELTETQQKIDFRLKSKI